MKPQVAAGNGHGHSHHHSSHHHSSHHHAHHGGGGGGAAGGATVLSHGPPSSSYVYAPANGYGHANSYAAPVRAPPRAALCHARLCLPRLPPAALPAPPLTLPLPSPPITPPFPLQRVNFYKLDIAALRRYRRHYRLNDVGPNSSREELILSVRKHFMSTQVDEVAVIAAFMQSVKRRHEMALFQAY